MDQTDGWFAYLVVLMADLLLFLRREGASSARQIAILVLGQIVEGILNWLEGVRQGNKCQQNNSISQTGCLATMPESGSPDRIISIDLRASNSSLFRDSTTSLDVHTSSTVEAEHSPNIRPAMVVMWRCMMVRRIRINRDSQRGVKARVAGELLLSAHTDIPRFIPSFP